MVLLTTLNNVGSITLFNAVFINPEQVVHFLRCNLCCFFHRPRGPLRWLDPGAFGTLGVGGGFALGAKLCRPESEIWIIYGDGTCGYSVAEFDTFSRHRVSYYDFSYLI